MWLQTMAFERGPAKRVILTLITLGYDFAQSHFDKGFQGCLFLLRQFARFLEKAVRYMYGCLHTYNHIILYGSMSKNVPAKTYHLIVFIDNENFPWYTFIINEKRPSDLPGHLWIKQY